MTEHHPSCKSPHLRLTVRWQSPHDQNAVDACWDALIAWCDQRGAYLGGTSSVALILVNPVSPRLLRPLRRWLSARPCIEAFELLPTAWGGHPQNTEDAAPDQQLSWTTTPDGHKALLEALANYQQHLVEEFQWTVSLLPSLRVPARSAGQVPPIRN